MPAPTYRKRSISSLPDSYFAVVQVKKARKSGKVTSQKTQVSIPKKLAAFRVGQQKGKVEKLEKATKKLQKAKG